MEEYLRYIADFVFYYPIVMSYVWMTGGLLFYWKTERKLMEPPDPRGYGPFSILIPCHNEQRLIRQTVENLLGLDYPDYEIVLVDDGSTDGTASILGELCSRHERVRALYLKKTWARARP